MLSGIAHAAGIEQNHISLRFVWGHRIAFGHELRGDRLAVALIHLASVSFNENTRHFRNGGRYGRVGKIERANTVLALINRALRPRRASAKTPQPSGNIMADTKSLSERRQAYWRDNIRIMAWLMAVWFIVSYGCGILLVEPLNKISLGGYKLGFWMAQQGSIYVFVILIFVYVRLMNQLDEKHGFAEAEEPSAASSETEPESKEDA